jgi:hypothetical protein
MKMLRRTWSITKGSLGRMRRRASGECENPAEGAGAGDAKKYFSFKKHFRKSQATGLSTFYLDKATAPGGVDGTRDKSRQEPVYSNSNWYREAGLYSEQQSPKLREADVGASTLHAAPHLHSTANQRHHTINVRFLSASLAHYLFHNIGKLLQRQTLAACFSRPKEIIIHLPFSSSSSSPPLT